MPMPGSALGQDQPKCADAWVSPSGLVQRFYDRAGFPDRTAYYAGEMLEHYADAPSLGMLLPDDVRVQHRAVRVTCERAVYATTVSADERGEDWYLHMLWEGDRWKIEAVRRLALTGMLYLAMEGLANNPEAMDQSAAILGEDAPRLSAAEMLANIRLTLSTDAELKLYFAEHRSELVHLAAAFEQRPSLTFVASDGRARPEGSDTAALAAEIRQLSLNAVYRTASRPGCTFLSIGGLVDNEVGYLYAPPGCAVPEMAPDLFILVEPMADGWFLFKTT
jgi:hypothetical protein